MMSRMLRTWPPIKHFGQTFGGKNVGGKTKLGGQNNVGKKKCS